MTKYLTKADWYLMTVNNGEAPERSTYARMKAFLISKFDATPCDAIEAHDALLDSGLWKWVPGSRPTGDWRYVPVFETPKDK